MSTHILFEHPLNEKMRTWLRIEFLIQQLSQHLPVNDHATALHFFRNVSDPEEPERKRMPFLRYNAGLRTDIDPLSYDGISIMSG